MSKVLELFGKSTQKKQSNWKQIVTSQQCIYTKKKCYKIRKSDPEMSIGTCTVAWHERGMRVRVKLISTEIKLTLTQSVVSCA